MPELGELEKGLVEALSLKPDEIVEAKYNLLGFFNALYKIDQRLKKQAEEAANVGVSRD